MCHFRESIPVALKIEIDHYAKENPSYYTFLSVTVEFYQTNVGRKTTVSILVSTGTLTQG